MQHFFSKVYQICRIRTYRRLAAQIACIMVTPDRRIGLSVPAIRLGEGQQQIRPEEARRKKKDCVALYFRELPSSAYDPLKHRVGRFY